MHVFLFFFTHLMVYSHDKSSLEFMESTIFIRSFSFHVLVPMCRPRRPLSGHPDQLLSPPANWCHSSFQHSNSLFSAVQPSSISSKGTWACCCSTALEKAAAKHSPPTNIYHKSWKASSLYSRKGANFHFVQQQRHFIHKCPSFKASVPSMNLQ